MNAKLAYNYISQIFSDKGLNIKGIEVKSKSPSTIEIQHEHDRIIILFKNKINVKYTVANLFFKPYVSLNLIGLEFNPGGGVVQIENFPDIPFDYESLK